MEEDPTKDEKTDEQINEEIDKETEFFENLLKTIGVDIDGISEKIEVLKKSKESKDPQACITALHDLLNTIGESTETAAPGIKLLKKEAISALKPIIDLLLKDSLVDIYGYLEEIKADCVEQTLEAHKRMNGAKAKLLADSVNQYIENGFSREEALTFIRAELGKPQYISLNYSPHSFTSQESQRTKEQIISDFMKVAQEDPEILLKLLLTARNKFARTSHRESE